MKAVVIRKTRSGNWMAQTPKGKEILLPRRDVRLDIGVEVDISGIERGRNVNFPTKYTIASQDYGSVLGIISERDMAGSAHGPDFTRNYWGAETERGKVYLEKTTGPKDVDLGTMVALSEITGGHNNFSSSWEVAETQYGENEFSEEQLARAKDFIQSKLNGSRNATIGTVVLHNKPGMLVLADSPRIRGTGFGRPKVANLTQILEKHYDRLPIGARLVYGEQAEQLLIL